MAIHQFFPGFVLTGQSLSYESGHSDHQVVVEQLSSEWKNRFKELYPPEIQSV